MSLIDMGRSPSSNGPAALGGSDILFLGGSAAAAAVTSTPAALPAAASTSRAVFLDPPALPPVAVGPAGVRHHDVCDLGGMLRDLGDRRPPAVGWIVDEDAVHHDRVRLDFLFSKGTSPARPHVSGTGCTWKCGSFPSRREIASMAQSPSASQMLTASPTEIRSSASLPDGTAFRRGARMPARSRAAGDRGPEEAVLFSWMGE